MRRPTIKRFHFSLDALLKVRKHEENRALGKLALVMERFNREQEQQQRSAHLVEEELENFRRSYAAAPNMELHNSYTRYINRLEREAEDARERAEAITPELNQEQEHVREARRALRIVEMLREKRLDEYKRAALKSEQRELEELYRLNQSSSELSGTASLIGPSRSPSLGSIDKSDRDGDFGDYLEYDDESAFAESEDRKGDALTDFFKQHKMDDPRKGGR